MYDLLSARIHVGRDECVSQQNLYDDAFRIYGMAFHARMRVNTIHDNALRSVKRERPQLISFSYVMDMSVQLSEQIFVVFHERCIFIGAARSVSLNARDFAECGAVGVADDLIFVSQ